MPIIGIDYNKCTNCGLCIKECRRRFSKNEEVDRVEFEDSTGSCMQCGHCIVICPQDAILYDDLGDEPFYFDGINNLADYIPYERIINFLRAIRSTRFYKKEKVPKDIIKKVIRAMEYAPTGANVRSEKIAVISDKERLRKLSEAVLNTLLEHPANRSRFEASFEIRKKYYEYPVYFDAPHVIFVYGLGNTTMDHFNIVNMINYGRIAAESLGLGTCFNGWTQMAFESNPKLRKVAGVRGKSWGVYTLGYPEIKYLKCPPRSSKKIKWL